MSDLSEYKTVNVVTGPYSAIVDRQPTGLAGCTNMSCPVRAGCLRGDDILVKSVSPSYSPKIGCPLFVGI